MRNNRGVVVKKIAGSLLVAALLAWCAFVVYGWITYTGAWQWMAEWEIQQFGAYREKATLLALIAGPILLLNLPILLINIIRPGSVSYQLLGRPTVGTQGKPGNPGKLLAAIAVVALVAGTAAGAIAYQQSQTPVTFEAIDLARSGSTPATRHITLSGIARTESIVVLKKTTGSTTSEETYLPVTAPNWRKGEPVSFFLSPRSNAYVGADGFQMYAPNTRPFAIQQTGTVFSDGLPGLVRTEFERRGIVMASKIYVVDTKTDADLGLYYGIAFASGLCLIVVLMTMLILHLKRPRRVSG